MKTFIISIPKSGTYLMRELFDNIGLDSSYLHISEKGIYDYSKVSLEEGRKNPKACFTPMPLEKSLSKIQENSFAVGHLKYSEQINNLLNSFNIIFIKRDIKETILSYMIFELQTNRANRKKINKTWIAERDTQKQFIKYMNIHGDNIAKEYSEILLWERHIKNSNCFNFDELIINPVIQIKKIANSIQINISDSKIKHVVESSFNKKTLTMSSKIDKEIYWSSEARHKLNALIIKHEIGR